MFMQNRMTVSEKLTFPTMIEGLYHNELRLDRGIVKYNQPHKQ